MNDELYDPARVGTLYLPDMARAVTAGLAAGLAPASTDTRRVMLLLIDVQVDFVFPDGTLTVPGAVDDTRRTIGWLYRNMAAVTTIAATLDSHLAYQIFSPLWWADPHGNHPAPYTVISIADVQGGVWRPLRETAWSARYVEELARGGRYELMIWPYHTLIGTPGHALVPALAEAVMTHAAARATQPVWLLKGTIPQTEYYSALEPEVKVPGHPQGGLDTPFLETLASYDLVYIAGQAKSHCVLATLRSIMHYAATRPDLIGKLRVLLDCMSSVQHPTIDFEALANTELDTMAAQGLRLVHAADPLG